MKILISTLLICLMFCFCYSQTKTKKVNSANNLTKVKIDENKADVYITYENISTYTSKRNETYKVVWLRLHNNLKGSISFFSYDDSLTPTGKKGIHYGIEKVPSYDESKNGKIPIGYPPDDLVFITVLKSGKSYLFGIPEFHLIDYTHIKIQFFYPWEVGQEFDFERSTGKAPEHFIYFNKIDVPKEEDSN